MKKYCFIIMGDYDMTKDIASFERGNLLTEFRGVRDFQEAKILVDQLKDRGFGAIETCGAFTERNIEILKELTEGKIALARVVADSDMKILMDEFFSN